MQKTDKEISIEIQGKLREKYKDVALLCKVGEKCTCPGACPLHGNCAACVAWHRDHAMNPLPNCLRNQRGVSFEKHESLRNIDRLD